MNCYAHKAHEVSFSLNAITLTRIFRKRKSLLGQDDWNIETLQAQTSLRLVSLIHFCESFQTLYKVNWFGDSLAPGLISIVLILIGVCWCCQVLIDLGCVRKRFTVQPPKPSLFSKPGVPQVKGQAEVSLRDAGTAFYEPTVDCILRLARVFPHELNWNKWVQLCLRAWVHQTDSQCSCLLVTYVLIWPASVAQNKELFPSHGFSLLTFFVLCHKMAVNHLNPSNHSYDF